jgi:hypothetical protein
MFKSSIFSLVLAAAAPALAQKADVPLSEPASVGIYENPVRGQPPAQQLSDESACWQQAQSANTFDAIRDAYADCLRSRGYEAP